MFDKMMMRKKAMDMMMKSGPSMELRKKPARPQSLEESIDSGMEGMSGEELQDQPNEAEAGEAQQGFIQFMVSPEEKEAILQMRKTKNVQGAEIEA